MIATNAEPAKLEAKPEKKERRKNDQRPVAAARELKDRWLERLNETPLLSCGKYEVSQQIDAGYGASGAQQSAAPLLVA